MNSSWNTWFLRPIKWVAIFLVVAFIAMLSIPIFFPDAIARKVRYLINKEIDGELSFQSARLSFFTHFPSLTLSLNDFVLKGSSPFERDTLIAGKELGFGINLADLLKQEVSVEKFYLDKAYINIQVNEKGIPNYNIYKSKDSISANQNDTASAKVALDKIIISNSRLVYHDRSLPMRIETQKFNYTGKGDLTQSVFDLQTKVNIGRIDVTYDNIPYLLEKEVKGELITQINTQSLALVFKKNKIRINRLPLEFTGKLGFLSSGYEMDFTAQSLSTTLEDMLSALPPSYKAWLTTTRLKGQVNLIAGLKGNYDAATNQMPHLKLDLRLRDGFVCHNAAPFPIEKLFMDMKLDLPNLNPSSAKVDIDTISMYLQEDYLRGMLHVVGLDKPMIRSKLDASIDLQTWNQALALGNFTAQGKLMLQTTANGVLAWQYDPDAVLPSEYLQSIPAFELSAQLEKGYFKLNDFPQALEELDLDVHISAKGEDWRNTLLDCKKLHLRTKNSQLKARILYGLMDPHPVDGTVDAKILLSDIQEIAPIPYISKIGGLLEAQLESKGSFVADTRTFPPIQGKLTVSNGLLQTPYYPNALEAIQMAMYFQAKSASPKDLSVQIPTFHWEFEGKPFDMQATFKDFSDLNYDVQLKGKIDIGKLYQVFKIEGYDVAGKVSADLAFAGKKSDALKMKYHLLKNRGTLEMYDLSLRSFMFPKPLQVSKGLFHFEDEKLIFDECKIVYGSSKLQVNGYLNHVVNYILHNQTMQGKWKLYSPALYMDEWMEYNELDSTTTGSVGSTPTGVLMLPNNLDIRVEASADKVNYHGMDMQQLKGSMHLKPGKLLMDDASFTIAGTDVTMKGWYEPIKPKLARFSYVIETSELDVQQAYRDFALFREMAPAAKRAEGKIAFDYALEGRLNADMMPVMNSLKGGGSLRVRQVKMYGFRLFNAAAKASRRSEIKDPDISNVVIRTKIQNNLLTIEKTKMRVAGFRPKLEGQMRLDDGRLNMRFRLGLPPLGIFGIPMTVTGTRDHPIVKLRRGKKADELEEDPEEADEDDEVSVMKSDQ